MKIKFILFLLGILLILPATSIFANDYIVKNSEIVSSDDKNDIIPDSDSSANDSDSSANDSDSSARRPDDYSNETPDGFVHLDSRSKIDASELNTNGDSAIIIVDPDDTLIELDGSATIISD